MYTAYGFLGHVYIKVHWRPLKMILMIMMAKDIRECMGPKFSRICLAVEKKRQRNPQPGKLTRPGNEPYLLVVISS